MKNARVLLIVVSLLLGVSLSCKLLKSSSPSGGVGDSHKEAIPSVHANAAFPALSADVLDALIVDIPELAKLREAALEAERAAINGVLADVRAKSQASAIDSSDSVSDARPQSDASSLASFGGQINLFPVAYAGETSPNMPNMGGVESYLIGHQIGFFNPDAGAGTIRETDRGKSETKSIKDEETGTVQASMTTSVNPDGSLSVELTTSMSMPLFGLNANSRVKITGNNCPNSEGKVDLTVEYGSNGRAGSSNSMIYDKTLTANVKTTVNDNAEVASIDVEVKQATRSTAGGRQVFVETSQSGRGTTGHYSDIEFGDLRIDRTSSQVTQTDAALSDAGLKSASRLAQGVLDSAKERWQGGGCVRIEATSPGSVAVNSSIQIPVKVVHKIDGSDVPSKLTAELSGGSSIDPTLIPKTAGSLTYVAPGEMGKTATIKLTSNSRRGRAQVDLTASTGGRDSYHIVGGLDDFQTSTDVCDIMKPFTLTGGGFTNNFSGGMSGSYNFTGPFQSEGSGTYTISLPDGPGKPGTMTGQGSGSVLGRYTGTGTEKYTLTPIEPCS